MSHVTELRAYEELRKEVDFMLAEWRADLVADLTIVGKLQKQQAGKGREYFSELASQSVIQPWSGGAGGGDDAWPVGDHVEQEADGRRRQLRPVLEGSEQSQMDG